MARRVLLVVSLVGVVAAGVVLDAMWARAGSRDARSGVIAFESFDGLYVVDAAGGQVRKIRGTRSGDGDPAWSPDGQRIAFDRVTVRGGERRDIWVMNANGTRQRRLTFNTLLDEAYPRWAPHGRSLTYMREPDGTVMIVGVQRRKVRGIVRVQGRYPDWAGNGRIYFTWGTWDTLASVRPYGPDWQGGGGRLKRFVRVSRDVTRIVYLKETRTGRWEAIYAADIDGSHEMRLATTPARQTNPGWSPDGRWVAYGGITDDDSEIYVVQSNGRVAVSLTSMNQPETCCPDWRSG